MARQAIIRTQEILRVQKEGVKALNSEAAELKRARIMNRAEPNYERKNGKL